MLAPHNAVEILLIISISTIKLGSSLVCYQCVGTSCNAHTKDMETCNSDDFCYLTRNDGEEQRGCESTEGCSAPRARRGGQLQHYTNINGNECRICNQRLCNGGPQTWSRTVDCYKCEGEQCKEDEETMPTCESSICFFVLKDGVEKRGCGARPVLSASSSAVQFSCTYDKCNSQKQYAHTQEKVRELQEQMVNLGNRLREDQTRLQHNMNEQMENFGKMMGNQMKNIFSNMNLFRR